MVYNVFKSAKYTFGAKSFKFSRPSNGTYLRLILTSISKKGNWGGLFKKFTGLSLNSRKFNLLTTANLARPHLSDYNFLSFNQSKDFLNKKDLLIKVSNKLSKKMGSPFHVIKRRLLLTDTREKGLLQSVSRRGFLSSLRTIHSIFCPISVSIELKSKRRGGRVFLVPVPVKSEKRRFSVFIRWFKKSITEQSGAPLDKFLLEELNQLTLRQGKSIDQLVALEKTIKINRVFLRKSQIKLV